MPLNGLAPTRIDACDVIGCTIHRCRFNGGSIPPGLRIDANGRAVCRDYVPPPFKLTTEEIARLMQTGTVLPEAQAPTTTGKP